MEEGVKSAPTEAELRERRRARILANKTSRMDRILGTTSSAASEGDKPGIKDF